MSTKIFLQTNQVRKTLFFITVLLTTFEIDAACVEGIKNDNESNYISLKDLHSIIFKRGTTNEDSKVYSTNGEANIQDSIFSSALNRHIKYTIHKPQSYKYTTTKTFPLVVLFDRQNEGINKQIIHTIQYLESNDQIPHSVILEIETDFPDRWEYSDHPSVRESGKMVVFAEFIHQDLISKIQTQYRTNNNKILIGHSAMGHFTNYVLAEFPEEWSCIISISSFFKVKKFNLIDTLSSKIATITGPLVFYTAQGHPHQDTNQDLLFDSLYRVTQPNSNFIYKRYSYPTANHNVVPGIAIGEILTDFWGYYNIRKIELAQKNYNSKGEMSADTLIQIYSGLKNHYKDTIYYELGNIVGSSNTYSTNKKYEQSIRMLVYGIQQYPNYYPFYVSLADRQFKLNADADKHNTYILKAIETVKNNPDIYEDSDSIVEHLNMLMK